MPTRYLQYVNPQSRFAIWAWGPVIFLRISLFATYILYVYASVIAFLAGIPIFDLTTPRGYTPIWAVLLGAGAVISAVGSLADRWQRVEKWATLGLSSMVLTYVGALNGVAWVDGDIDRQFIGVIALIAAVLPFTRFIYLAAQSGKKKHVGPTGTVKL